MFYFFHCNGISQSTPYIKQFLCNYWQVSGPELSLLGNWGLFSPRGRRPAWRLAQVAAQRQKFQNYCFSTETVFLLISGTPSCPPSGNICGFLIFSQLFGRGVGLSCARLAWTEITQFLEMWLIMLVYQNIITQVLKIKIIALNMIFTLFTIFKYIMQYC